ncbi:isoamyl alcohol oxidase [Stemphylium lycopersici]|uniref:Isoamyl alcohol oxidase n=1 Tax=Stemphylium lycopersici TaxID=183478 RepID=A0A364MS87_STELY|nr:isoamyl alcohol oxidase [Stemphylium lycopersici]RAR01831.1 isoamyl alcohol oxidase [Stemphylium lycopersici]
MRFFYLAAAPTIVSGATTHFCRSNPSSASWPSTSEWASLNATIHGSLIRTVPSAASCWPSNTTSFDSPISCDAANEGWSSGIWHSTRPESIDYPIWANNSCLPDEVGSYTPEQGCSIGGMPQYIVNATAEVDVARAMKWAADRNIRVVVKGTGHDLNGRATMADEMRDSRSSGAFSLSIWTRNFRHLARDTNWSVPNNGSCNTTTTEDVFVVGSGQQWGNVLTEATKHGRVVTTGQDPSVGLGGYIQGGGHGPLASTYGLASSQVLQMRVATTTGHVLVANEVENTDLFWALRGGGAGQYGVVTEYVIKHFPAPSNVIMGTVVIKPNGSANASMKASWDAVASWLGHLPDFMDAGLAGAATVAVGTTASKFFPDMDTSNGPFTGIALNQVFWAFNSTEDDLEALVQPVLNNLQEKFGNDNSTLSLSISTSTFDNYTSFFSVISGSEVAGGESLASSRLLGRAELVDTPHTDVVSYLRTAMASQDESAGNYATIGLSGGPGVINTPEKHWGALLPAWRNAYLHFIATGATVDSVAAGSAKRGLQSAAAWQNEVKEPNWRKWSPNSGAYMNEANPYNDDFQNAFYGAGYNKLKEIKAKYDPTESLYVLSGVGTEKWDYDLDTGKLCMV